MALLHLNLYSEVLGMSTSVEVILPQATASQIGMDGTRENVFPTLYLLHGLSDDHTIWQRRTSIERYAARYGIAVVMPNADRSWYTDMHRGGKYFTYIFDELPALCRSFFNGMSAEREYNYVAGLSMGGYGALKMAMADPKRFAGAAAFSGSMDMCRHIEREGLNGYCALGDIFGGLENVVGTINDVYGTVERRVSEGVEFPKIYLSCGTEDRLLPDTQKMHALLDKHGVSHFYREAPGYHCWDFWDSEIQLALKYFFEPEN